MDKTYWAYSTDPQHKLQTAGISNKISDRKERERDIEREREIKVCENKDQVLGSSQRKSLSQLSEQINI